MTPQWIRAITFSLRKRILGVTLLNRQMGWKQDWSALKMITPRELAPPGYRTIRKGKKPMRDTQAAGTGLDIGKRWRLMNPMSSGFKCNIGHGMEGLGRLPQFSCRIGPPG